MNWLINLTMKHFNIFFILCIFSDKINKVLVSQRISSKLLKSCQETFSVKFKVVGKLDGEYYQINSWRILLFY